MLGAIQSAVGIANDAIHRPVRQSGKSASPQSKIRSQQIQQHKRNRRKRPVNNFHGNGNLARNIRRNDTDYAIRRHLLDFSRRARRTAPEFLPVPNPY